MSDRAAAAIPVRGELRAAQETAPKAPNFATMPEDSGRLQPPGRRTRRQRRLLAQFSANGRTRWLRKPTAPARGPARAAGHPPTDDLMVGRGDAE